MASEVSEADTQSPPAPPVYNFYDWELFYCKAMQYHETMYPDARRVIDRMRTLRRFMSPRVRVELGSLVTSHPRYRTEVGWDQWVTDVKTKLLPHDNSFYEARTPQQWVNRYWSGRCTTRGLWEVLDSFVESRVIRSVDQRTLFWNALNNDTRRSVVSICPYFDPAHSVWTSKELDATAHAEQQLSRAMEVVSRKDAVALRKGELRAIFIATAIFALITYCSHVCFWSMDEGFTSGAVLFVGIISGPLAFGFLIWALNVVFDVRDLQRLEREAAARFARTH